MGFSLGTKRIDSLKAMIVISIVGIVFVTLLLSTVLLVYGAKSRLLTLSEGGVRSLLEALKKNVRIQHKSILYYKEKAYFQRKRGLRFSIDIVYGLMRKLHGEYLSGRIGLRAAQQRIIDFVNRVRYGGRVGYFWINDIRRPYPRMIVHPTIPHLNGRILNSPKFNCALGRGINLFKAFVDVCLRKGEGYVDYLWPKPTGTGLTSEQPKISFVRLFRPWGWIVGSGVYVDDIERDVDEKIRAAIKEFNALVLKDRIGREGYYFIFDGKNRFLVHPSLAGTDGNKLVNPRSGKKLLEEFKRIVAEGGSSMEYLWDKPGYLRQYQFEKKAFITYFKPLDWYIVCSIYKDDYTAQVRSFVWHMILFSGLSFVLALVLSLVIARRVLKPFSSVMEIIQETDGDGVPIRVLPEYGPKEIVSLSSVINKIVATISESRERLNAHRNYLQSLIDNSPELIFALTMEGDIKFINPAGRRLLGFIDSEIVGSKWYHFVTFSGDRKRFRECVRLFQNQGLLNYSMTMVTSDGHPRTVLLTTVSRRNEQDGKPEYLGFGRDISQRLDAEHEKQELQRQLAHRHKMDAIGQLAGGVAHDFNNMLAGIISSAQLLQSPRRNLDDKGRKYIDLILRAAERAANLTARLLTFSRKGKICSTVLNVDEIINDTVTILKQTIDRRVAISLDNQAYNCRVIGDNSALQNAFMNIGINASQAMVDGGHFQIRMRNLDLPDEYCRNSPFELQAGEYLEIEFRDNGPGISGDIIDRIFDPFFTTKDQGKGTGLGLAAVYGTVQDHHGSITVYSEIDMGSVFHILLPCTAGEKSVQRYGKEIIKGVGKILLVDDEELIRITGKSMLEELGYTVLLAENGKRALDLFRVKHDELDLVLMDMIMPEMNGSEAFLKMKEIDDRCRVIISSGFTRDENLGELRNRGLSGFIQKPFQLYELSQLLASVMEEDHES